MHNFFLENDTNSNPSPFIGDVQLQAFLSVSKNQIKWAKAYGIFQKREHNLELWVKGEPMKPMQLIIRHQNFMRRPGVKSRLGPFHKDVIENARDYFEDIREASLAAAKQRWMASTNNVKNREPFNYRNFKAVASRFHLYRSSFYSMGPTWLGCKYRNPLLWLPPCNIPKRDCSASHA